MTYLTQVDTEFLDGRCNYRILFGCANRTQLLEQIRGRTWERHWFVAGSRFALDLWRRNAYGTIQWRCFVCEAVGPGNVIDTLPCVRPGARVLLATHGAAQSKLFLAWLNELELAGVSAPGCPRETFEAAHFRLMGLRADRVPPRRLSGLL